MLLSFKMLFMLGVQGCSKCQTSISFSSLSSCSIFIGKWTKWGFCHLFLHSDACLLRMFVNGILFDVLWKSILRLRDSDFLACTWGAHVSWAGQWHEGPSLFPSLWFPDGRSCSTRPSRTARSKPLVPDQTPHIRYLLAGRHRVWMAREGLLFNTACFKGLWWCTVQSGKGSSIESDKTLRMQTFITASFFAHR